MNEDPEAPNYDPEHRIIRSYFNGSRGPLLRHTTAVDWAGDPFEPFLDAPWTYEMRLGAHGIMQLSVYGAALGGGPVKPAHREIRAFTRSRRNSP